MKRISLAVLAVIAAVSGQRGHGFCTANTQAEDIAALQKQNEELLANQVKQQDEINALRAAAATPVPVALPEDNSTTALLIKGADVDPGDVHWRIRAGLSAEQAVQVALSDKEERARVAAAEKKAGAPKKGGN